MDEVRFDRMVPSQVVARREACNLAYLPVGSLEWHGPHMPFGTDYMTVEYLAGQCAQRFGGVAFPPIFYGDVRYILQENRAEWRKSYLKEMKVPEAYPTVFPLSAEDGSPGYDCPSPVEDGPPASDPLDFSRKGMEAEFARHIARQLLTIHLYGFRNIMLLPGHGPNPGYCKAAEAVYRENVGRYSKLGSPARTVTYFYIEAAKETEPLLNNHWIHADKWEGSLTMAAQPDTVHPELLPEEGLVPAYLGHPYLGEDTGYNPEFESIWYSFDALDPRNGTSVEYGQAQWDAILPIIGQLIEEFTTGAPAEA